SADLVRVGQRGGLVAAEGERVEDVDEQRARPRADRAGRAKVKVKVKVAMVAPPTSAGTTQRDARTRRRARARLVGPGGMNAPAPSGHSPCRDAFKVDARALM